MKTYLSNYKFWIIVVFLLMLGFIHNTRLFSLNINPFITVGLSRYTFERILFLAIIIFAGYTFGKKTGITCAVISLGIMLPNSIFLASSLVDALFETLGITVIGLLVVLFFDMRNRDIAEIKKHEEHVVDLSRRLISAYEMERGRIGQDLHDSVGQSLTVVSLAVQHLRKSAPNELVLALDEVESLLGEVVRDVRDVARMLKPPLLENAGLLVALEAYFKLLRSRGALQVDFTHTGSPWSFTKVLETVAFRIIQEALTNVSHHAGVKDVKVSISVLDNKLTLEIADRGIGFDNSSLSGESLGIRGMRERAELIGGTFMVDSRPGEGTRIKADFPLEL